MAIIQHHGIHQNTMIISTVTLTVHKDFCKRGFITRLALMSFIFSFSLEIISYLYILSSTFKSMFHIFPFSWMSVCGETPCSSLSLSSTVSASKYRLVINKAPLCEDMTTCLPLIIIIMFANRNWQQMWENQLN